MNNIKQLSPYGKGVLIITSILSLGLVWVFYLCMYGFYEMALNGLKKKNEGVKRKSSLFAKLSHVSYWIFFIIAPIIWYVRHLTNKFNSELSSPSDPFEGAGAVFAHFYLIVGIIITVILIMGIYISVYPLVQYGIKLMIYPNYELTKGSNLLILFGTILTLGLNWIIFLIVFGIHTLIVKLYNLEQSHSKGWSTFGVISAIMYGLYLIYIINNYISSQDIQDLIYVIAILIGSISLYGLLQVAALQINKNEKRLSTD